MGSVVDVFRIRKEKEEGGYVPHPLFSRGSWEQLEVVKPDNTIYVKIRKTIPNSTFWQFH